MKESSTEPKLAIPSGHERSDIDPVSMGLIVMLLVIGLALVEITGAGVLAALNQHFSEGSAERIAAAPRIDYPSPRLQFSPTEDMQAFRNREETFLHTYGWSDRDAGIVRIPIERAMELLVERGLPDTGVAVTPAEIQQKRPSQIGARPAKTKESAP